jgi:hypothetical protein
MRLDSKTKKMKASGHRYRRRRRRRRRRPQQMDGRAEPFVVSPALVGGRHPLTEATQEDDNHHHDTWPRPFKKRRLDSAAAHLKTTAPALWLISSALLTVLGCCRCAGQAYSSSQADQWPAPMRRHHQIYPSVWLPKYGLARGLRFDSVPASDSGDQHDDHEERTDDNGSRRRFLGQPPQTVAAFLGVPYAAPPTGPLRFMPPGAARPAGQRVPADVQCSLMADDHDQHQHHEGGARGGRPATSSRPFVEFGHQCVRLADWLPPAGSGARAQSEDCLNLNVFVPLEPNEVAQRRGADQKQQLDEIAANRTKAGVGRAERSRQAAASANKPIKAADQGEW